MKILVTIAGKIGDILYALPTIRLIKQQYDAEITLIYHEAYEEVQSILDHCTLIQHSFSVKEPQQFYRPHPDQWPIILKQEGHEFIEYDRIFNLSYQIARLECLETNSLRMYWEIANKEIEKWKEPKLPDISDYTFGLDNKYGIHHTLLEKLEKATYGKKFITIHPWTSAPERCWPLNELRMWEQLIDRFKDYRFVSLGIENEKEMCPANALNLHGDTTPWEAVSIIQKSVYHICIDSMGFAHLADEVGVPSTCIYTVTGPKQTGVYSKKFTPVGLSSPDVSYYYSPPYNHHIPTVDEVEAAVKKGLSLN